MKKVLCIMLALTTLLALGCSSKAEVTEPNETEPKPEVVVPDVDYVIYFDGSSLSASEQNDPSVTVGRSEAAGVPVEYFPEDCIFYPQYILSETVNDQSSSKTLIVDGRQYDLENPAHFEDSALIGKNSPLSNFSKIVRYSASGKYTIAYQLATDRLIELFDAKINRMVSGDFTKADAEAKSEKILKELYGEDCLEYYSAHPCQSSVIEKTIVVVYTKYIGGYPTNDQINLRFNMKGELCYLSAENYGLCESVAEKYPAKQLQNAETVLHKHLDSVAESYQDANLMMSTQGKCYLEIRANCGTKESIRMRTFYINVD